MMKLLAPFLCAAALLPFVIAAEPSLPADIPRRLVAIDNVCAWPNLVKLRDGSLIAVVFNQPNHARTEGDVEAWGSADGHFWNKLSTITRHEPQTVRMNHAAGLNASGDLVVLCNGWDKIAPLRNAESRTIQTVVCLSRDGGKTWPIIAPIVKDKHCEAAILHVGGGKWLAASRRFGILNLDIFASDDDALTWRHVTTLDIRPVSSAHLLRLSDGRVLLTYGNRGELPNRGIECRTSADGGRTWGQPQPLVALPRTDCGYPDTVELPGGRILIAYYSDRIPEHQRYHMGVINLSLIDIR